MKQTLSIALLALAGFIAPLAAAEEAPAAPAQASAPDNLGTPGKKPCNKPGMGMGMGMHGRMMGDGRACAKGRHDCPLHADMSKRVEQLEKRIDALQLTLEMLVRQQGK